MQVSHSLDQLLHQLSHGKVQRLVVDVRQDREELISDCMIFYLDDDVLDCVTQLYSYELVAVFHFFKFFFVLAAELRDLVDDFVKSIITALAEAH